jgi:DNA-directed RNA polymerase specialized sigma24 family protein
MSSASGGSVLFTGMIAATSMTPMIAILSQTAHAVGLDTAHEISVRLLELKPVRDLGKIGASSVGESWFKMLDGIGVQQPDRYVSRLARQVRAKRDQADADQRVLAKRRLLGLKAPKRRRSGGGAEPEWTEPEAPGPSASAGQPKQDSVLKEIERRDDFRALYDEIGRLPPEDQTLIRQVYWDYQSQSKIARETGQSPSAVRSRLDRLRDLLGARLADR